MHLRNNSLSGEIPSSIQNCTQLITFDVAENKLVGKLPTWLGLSLSRMKIIILRSNEFDGELNPELCNLTSLRILDVANNGFQGVIPSCFVNFTFMATVLGYDETDNYDHDGVPERERLATKGNEYNYDKLLHFLSIIDLSNNNFSGKIPGELTNLLGLLSLNLSGNQLGGMIPGNIGKMVRLESLDLSRNHLSGSIPSHVLQVGEILKLNLSHNSFHHIVRNVQLF